MEGGALDYGGRGPLRLRREGTPLDCRRRGALDTGGRRWGRRRAGTL